ncbi:MAG: class I tRNA ligase family protein [Candidatus Vogelbacteria bacterium]|nr:class I tRNA ligase family protein [Candidatus Vogelbacteria bacterium]
MEENVKNLTANERELRILKFWEENKMFEKSLEKTASKGAASAKGSGEPKEFVFYEGPPTANGKPGIHHLEARAFKDVIPRYKTMQGFHVRRKGGWDTHGLPVELQVEKKLGLNSKKAIEEYGIAKFNKECKESVWQYLEDWNKFTTRIGFWVDQKNPYVTYENNYIESVWNIVKTVNEKKLLFKDYKVVPWCPRCGTALSSHELAQGYQDDKDIAVKVKFRVIEGKARSTKSEARNKHEALNSNIQTGNTYILAWTTTPWTLPGNVALAVGEEIEYVKVRSQNLETGILNNYILAKARLDTLGAPYEIIEKLKGRDLLGLEYEPLYPFTENLIEGSEKEKMVNAYKIYPAKFVTTEDGTGVVHTAVMYGPDDFELGNLVGLPKHHLVKLDGTFVHGTGFLEGRFVKDEAVAVDIIKDLAHRGLLLKKEKYEHTYPHCWRCTTPLIYYARDSWYIRMSSLRTELVKENEGINWEPDYIKEGRFGEWLREIKDWAISRERYWGTPLPIWTTESGKIEVIGSIEEIKKKVKKSGNKYILVRHGESEANVLDIFNCDPTAPVHLTEKGKTEVKDLAARLKSSKIDLVVSSDFVRAKETAKIISDHLDISGENRLTEARFGEVNFGEFNLRPTSEYRGFFKTPEERMTITPAGGESYMDVRKRVMSALEDMETAYKDKTILIVGHGGPQWTLVNGCHGETAKEMAKEAQNGASIKLGEIYNIDYSPFPHDEDFVLDLHKPYIDEIELVSDSGEPMKRVKEVMDVWFDSGAMPFAQDHYPFDTKEPIYPADFISEAIDQTRGWFYTLHVVGILMGRGKAYKNVICLGHILDAQGKKMSKSVGNVVDPWLMMEKYGVDTLRLWMYSVNQPGESKNFDEKTVAELHNKFFNLLYNVLAFYELYAGTPGVRMHLDTGCPKSSNVLDQWIVAKLDDLIQSITESMDAYQTFGPVRMTKDFIDDLSTWYLRRSRDRLKDGDKDAKATLHYVLITLSKLIAPFAPFAAEDIWLRLRDDGDQESVHLAEWPELETRDWKMETGIIQDMKLVREIVTMGLEARARANIKVRQPLSCIKLLATNYQLPATFLELIKEELNVKEVVFVDSLETPVELDLKITPDLDAEGNVRELMRSIQEIRKTSGLQPQQEINLTLPERYKTNVLKFEQLLQKTLKTKQIKFRDQSDPTIEVV